jgi:hypothetical protein
MGGLEARMELDLKACLRRYHERFHYDIPVIEKRFDDHREGRKWLTPDDVTWLLHRDNAPFGNYWPEPSKERLDQLSRKRLYLDLPSRSQKDKKDLVRKLLETVLDLGVTSIILRFVHPHCFGVFSPPVHAVLLVYRMPTLDLYLAYCEELSEYKLHFNLSSVAEAEMAITGLYEILKGEYGQKETEAAQRSFKEDVWVQRRRAANVVRPFLTEFGKLQLARILLDLDSKLAGMIAGAEYEKLLGDRSSKLRGRKLTSAKGACKEFLDWLECKKDISASERLELDEVWNTRCAAVHEFGTPPSATAVERMIDSIEKICSGWESKR